MHTHKEEGKGKKGERETSRRRAASDTSVNSFLLPLLSFPVPHLLILNGVKGKDRCVGVGGCEWGSEGGKEGERAKSDEDGR